jgi:hypothetical protein
VIFVAENSNRFQKTRFWKEKSVEDVITLGPTAQATLVNMKIGIEKGEEVTDNKSLGLIILFAQSSAVIRLCSAFCTHYILYTNTIFWPPNRDKLYYSLCKTY